VKNIKKATDMKAEASAMFKNNNIVAAIQKFRECLQIDPYNINYNAAVYLNIGIALSKKGKNEEALDALNKAIELNPAYAKAYVKRGEVN
jgi:tetratricopeptide (TPR) repeat protein